MEVESAKNGDDVIVAEINGDGVLGNEDSSLSAEVSLDEKSPVTNGNNSMESTHAEDSLDADVTNEEIVPEADVPEIELIIKASTIDGRRKGACIFCHEYFMDLYLLAELKTISLKITTVDMKRPPADFRTNFEAAQPPILIDTGVAILENEKIERHIMKHVPGGHNLFVADNEVAKRIENLYNRFKVMLIKKDEPSRKSVINILKRLDDTLATKGTRFLTGDTLCCFDCELMPKLQHIRVAGRYFLNFDLPDDLFHLWQYVKEMYELDAFVQSCPADQDIIHMYKMQQMYTNTLERIKSREELEAPTYTTTVPESAVG